MAEHPKAGDATRLIHTGESAFTPLATLTVAPPLQRGSTVLLPDAASLYDPARPTYGMNSHAVHVALIDGLKALEHAAHVELFTSGLSAVTGAIMAVVGAGDEVLAVDSVYGPTRRFCDGVLKRFGVTTRYLPASADAQTIMAAVGERTRLIVLESPGSLTFEMQDIPAIAAAARDRGIPTAVDNTWAAGLLFRPLDHGVDLSIQALTKYVCGHSDIFMGSVATADAALGARLLAFNQDMGASVSPDDAFQALRGLRTLDVRLHRHGENGLKVARWLETQQQVARVLHPGLESHPDHALWKRDFTGACGLFGVVLQSGPEAAVHRVLDTLNLFGLGFSWGGYESLAIHCGPQIKRTAKAWRGGGPLLRLHVGLEDPDDLIADLKQALARYG